MSCLWIKIDPLHWTNSHHIRNPTGGNHIAVRWSHTIFQVSLTLPFISTSPLKKSFHFFECLLLTSLPPEEPQDKFSWVWTHWPFLAIGNYLSNDNFSAQNYGIHLSWQDTTNYVDASLNHLLSPAILPLLSHYEISYYL